jgi:protein TonB
MPLVKWLEAMPIFLSRDGTISAVEVVKGLEPELDEEAVAALKQWKVEPGQREGKPVAGWITVDFTFTLP